MNTTPQILRILPEVILTVVGVLIMLIEPVLPKSVNRKSLGWFTALGVVAALAASLYQYQLPAGTAYFGTVQTDAFSIFFHVLICGIVLASVLVSIDAIDGTSSFIGEYFALAAFGAVGMMLMTSAVELLLLAQSERPDFLQPEAFDLDRFEILIRPWPTQQAHDRFLSAFADLGGA